MERVCVENSKNVVDADLNALLVKKDLEIAKLDRENGQLKRDLLEIAQQYDATLEALRRVYEGFGEPVKINGRDVFQSCNACSRPKTVTIRIHD
jgi:hypothetical protein